MSDWGTDEARAAAKQMVQENIKRVPGGEEEQPSFSLAKTEKWLLDKQIYQNKYVCLILGKDGSGKTPLALSYLADEDIKNGSKVVVLDMDGGCQPLIRKYHEDRCKKFGREVGDVFLVKDPFTEKVSDEGVVPDYLTTFNKIKGVVKLLKDDSWRQKQKIKYVILDGLSALLKYCENQMRLEKSLDQDGGVQLRYWLRRNQLFLEITDAIKNLPISSFMIAHEDFILKTTGENSSVKEKINASVHQKILATKESLGFDKKVVFKATVLKSKYNIKLEGKEIVFGEVQQSGDFEFNPQQVLEGLI